MGKKSWHRRQVVNNKRNPPPKKQDTSNHTTDPSDDVSKAEDPPGDIPRCEPYVAEEKRRAEERIFWERQLRLGRCLNWITLGAAIVGLIGLGFVYLSLRSADFATKEANRAWLAPENFSFGDFVSGQPITITGITHNIGKEPALWPSFEYPLAGVLPISPEALRFNGLIKVPDIDMCPPSLVPIEGNVIFPDQKYPYDIQVRPDSKGYPTESQFKDILEGRAVFYLRSCVAYKTFSERHTSPFCYYLIRDPFTGKMRVVHSWTGNGAD